MNGKYRWFWVIFIGFFFTEIGLSQSKNNMQKRNEDVLEIKKESNTASSQRPWFPLMKISPRITIHGYNKNDYLVGDTLLTQPPPDSVEVTLTTSGGDHEKIWLGDPYLFEWRPGVLCYWGWIVVGENEPPIPDDGILQVNSKEPGYIKMTYRSFNDQRVYVYRFEWLWYISSRD